MSFLAPLFLFGLLAAAIPLAIHLIKRDKPPRVVFSTLRFFQKTSRKQFLFQKMQQWLLLLLRTLVVLLLVFAFARPFLSGSLSQWADLAPRSVVVLMDNSMSMTYGDTFERAKAETREILNGLNAGDEATLIVFTDTVEAVHGPSTDFADLSRIADGLPQPGQQASRYFPALRLADELLEQSRNEEKLVYLVSDFQKTAMQDFADNWKLKPGVQFMAANVGQEKTRNLAITGVKAPSYLRKAEAEDEIFVRVRTLGSLRQDAAQVEVSVDGREQFKQTIQLADQSEAVVRVPVSFSGEGSHVGKVSVEDPDFPADNDFHFTVDVLPRIPILLVNGEGSSNWFEDEGHWFRLAASGHEQSPFVVTEVNPAQFDPERLREFRIVALLNVSQLSLEQADALGRFVREGGSLLLAPGDRAQPAGHNSRLAPFTPASLLERAQLGSGDYLLIADINERHPILRGLNMDWTARFNQSWRLKPEPDSEALMSFDNGAPALLERKVGEGRTLMFASSLDLEWNNLALQSMYLPLIHESLKYLANTVDKKTAYRLGEQLSLRGLAGSGELRGPDGEPLALPEGEEALTLQRAGVYMQGDKESAVYYAVNRPLEESDLSSVAPATVLDQVVNSETAPRQSAEIRSQLLKLELEKPQRLWWWLLLAVALLLVTEAIIANRTYR